MGLKTWFKQMGGTLIACLLLSFVVVPTLDSAVCATDGERPVAQSHQQTIQGASADPQQDKEQDHGSEVCIHGHCHHASPFVGAALDHFRLSNPPALHTTPVNLGFPPSSSVDRLKEPPRA